MEQTFIARVDQVRETRFSFTRASTYLRFYEIYQEKGEAFFAQLERRKKIEKMFQGSAFEKILDEKLVTRMSELSDAELAQLQAIIQKTGAKKFFDLELDENGESANFSVHNDSAAQRLEDFIGILKRHGPSFFENVKQLSGFNDATCLMLIPWYRFAEALEAEHVPLNEVLPELGGFVKGTHRSMTDVISYYFFYSFYPVMFDPHPSKEGGYTKMQNRPGYATFPQDLAKPVAWLYHHHLFHQALSEIRTNSRGFLPVTSQLTSLSRGGSVRDENTVWPSYQLIEILVALGKKVEQEQLIDAALDETTFRDKLRWALISVQMDALSSDYESPGGFFSLMETLRRSFRDLLSNAAPFPHEEELARLRTWSERVSAGYDTPKFRFREFPDIEKKEKAQALFFIMLTLNGKVPNDEELAWFEGHALKSPFIKNSDNVATVLAFYARSPQKIFEQCPLATKLLSNTFFDQHRHMNDYDFTDDFTLALRRYLDDAEVQKELENTEK